MTQDIKFIDLPPLILDAIATSLASPPHHAIDNRHHSHHLVEALKDAFSLILVCSNPALKDMANTIYDILDPGCVDRLKARAREQVNEIDVMNERISQLETSIAETEMSVDLEKVDADKLSLQELKQISARITCPVMTGKKSAICAAIHKTIKTRIELMRIERDAIKSVLDTERRINPEIECPIRENVRELIRACRHPEDYYRISMQTAMETHHLKYEELVGLDALREHLSGGRGVRYMYRAVDVMKRVVDLKGPGHEPLSLGVRVTRVIKNCMDEYNAMKLKESRLKRYNAVLTEYGVSSKEIHDMWFSNNTKEQCCGMDGHVSNNSTSMDIEFDICEGTWSIKELRTELDAFLMSRVKRAKELACMLRTHGCPLTYMGSSCALDYFRGNYDADAIHTVVDAIIERYFFMTFTNYAELWQVYEMHQNTTNALRSAQSSKSSSKKNKKTHVMTMDLSRFDPDKNSTGTWMEDFDVNTDYGAKTREVWYTEIHPSSTNAMTVHNLICLRAIHRFLEENKENNQNNEASATLTMLSRNSFNTVRSKLMGILSCKIMSSHVDSKSRSLRVQTDSLEYKSVRSRILRDFMRSYAKRGIMSSATTTSTKSCQSSNHPYVMEALPAISDDASASAIANASTREAEIQEKISEFISKNATAFEDIISPHLTVLINKVRTQEFAKFVSDVADSMLSSSGDDPILIHKKMTATEQHSAAIIFGKDAQLEPRTLFKEAKKKLQLLYAPKVSDDASTLETEWRERVHNALKPVKQLCKRMKLWEHIREVAEERYEISNCEFYARPCKPLVLIEYQADDAVSTKADASDATDATEKQDEKLFYQKLDSILRVAQIKERIMRRVPDFIQEALEENNKGDVIPPYAVFQSICKSAKNVIKAFPYVNNSNSNNHHDDVILENTIKNYVRDWIEDVGLLIQYDKVNTNLKVFNGGHLHDDHILRTLKAIKCRMTSLKGVDAVAASSVGVLSSCSSDADDKKEAKDLSCPFCVSCNSGTSRAGRLFHCEGLLHHMQSTHPKLAKDWGIPNNIMNIIC